MELTEKILLSSIVAISFTPLKASAQTFYFELEGLNGTVTKSFGTQEFSTLVGRVDTGEGSFTEASYYGDFRFANYHSIRLAMLDNEGNYVNHFIYENIYAGTNGGTSSNPINGFSFWDVSSSWGARFDINFSGDFDLTFNENNNIIYTPSNCSVLVDCPSDPNDVFYYSGKYRINDVSSLTGFISSVVTGGDFQYDLGNGDYRTALTFSTSSKFSSAVPEPSTYAMMLTGFGIIGFMATRRRKQA